MKKIIVTLYFLPILINTNIKRIQLSYQTQAEAEPPYRIRISTEPVLQTISKSYRKSD